MKVTLFLVIAFTFGGCHVACDRGGGIGTGAGGGSFGPASSQSPQQMPSRQVAVKVTKSGEVFFERRRVTVEELGAELGKLPQGEAGVCYFRESPEGEPHPAALEVLQKIVEARLPVRLSPEECE